MRLTLRTLLAHKDGVLERSDSELLESKIRESQLATTLRQRIDACMRRRHLGAPGVDGRGLGGDPNSVAEYLDNTLSQERISEFERICMESDVQLAEVAACHQVLTIVLEQPATVTTSLRSRIQALENADSKTLASAGVDVRKRGEQYARVDRAHATNTTTEEESDEEIVTAETVEHLSNNARASKHPDTIRKQGIDLSDRELTSRVPEYLRGRSTNGWRQAAFTLILVGLLVFLSWLTIGSLDSFRSLWSTEGTTAPNGPTEPKDIPNGKNGNALPGKSNDTPPGNKTTPATNGENGSGAPTNTASTNKETKSDLPSIENGRNDSDGNGAVKVAESSLENGEVRKENAAASNVDRTSSTDISNTKVPGKQLAGRWLPESLSAAEALLFWTEGDTFDAPKRSAAGEQFPAGARLTILPTFPTEITLEPGIIWSIGGPTDIRLMHRSDPIVPRVELNRGRAVVRPGVGAKAMELILDSKRSIYLEFADPSSIAGIELRRFWTPGARLDDASQVPNVIQIMALKEDLKCSLILSGKVEGAPIPIPFGSAFGWVEGTPPTTFTMIETPKWLTSVSPRPIDGVAARDLHLSLLSTKPEQMIAELKRLTTSHRPETAALAARTLMVLGDYTSVDGDSSLLMNARLRIHWNSILDELRTSLLMNDSRVRDLQGKWAKSYGEQANTLWGLLAGFSNEQLGNGGDKVLVEGLASSSLETRVIANYQLKHIVGSDFDYFPDHASTEALQVIRKLQSNNKIRYVTPPVPMPESIRQ